MKAVQLLMPVAVPGGAAETPVIFLIPIILAGLIYTHHSVTRVSE